MKNYLLFGTFLLSLLSFPIQKAVANPISFYTGAKLGYHHTFINNIDAKGLSGTPSARLKAPSSVSTSALPIGLSAGIIIPFTSLITMRTELEYSFVAPSISTIPLTNSFAEKYGLSHSTTMHRLFANMYLDIYATQKIYFYAAGGIGVAFIDTKTIASPGISFKDSSATQLAWNVGAGAGYHVTEKIFLDIGVRYVDSGSLDKYELLGPTGNPVLNISKTDYSSVEVLLTIAYKF